MKSATIGICLSSVMASCAVADVSFDASNGFGGAYAATACKVAVTNGVLRATEIGRDMAIHFSATAFEPNCIDTLEYRYRAKGTGDAGGQLYYWTDGAGASDFRKWNLPPPIADGEWHVVTQGLKSVRNPASWISGGTVTGLRLDPTDSAGGEIEYSYVRLKGAAPKDVRPAPEWQGRLDAPPWPDVEPKHYDHTRDPAFRMSGAYFKGSFISAADDAARKGGGRFLLRRRFDLKTAPADAWLQGMGDSEAKFTINGRTAMRARYGYSWAGHKTAMENVTPFLKAGTNVLEIEYTVNEKFEYGVKRSFPGGVLMELFAEMPDGSHVRIDSDSAFESSSDGKTWTGVALSEPPPAPPRATRFAYRDFAHPQELLGGGPETDRAMAGERVALRYEFRGAAPEGEFTVRLKMHRGGSVYWEEELELGPSNVVRLTQGRWRLDIPFSLPLYIAAGEHSLTLDSNTIFCRSGGAMGGRLAIVPSDRPDLFPRPVAAEMRRLDGLPTVHIDGRPFPLFWGGVARSKRPDGMPRHSDMPLTAVTVYCSYQKWHPRMGAYDFSVFDRTAEMYRRTNPDAYFIWDLTVYPPDDFAQRFPEEMSADDEGDRRSVGRPSWG